MPCLPPATSSETLLLLSSSTLEKIFFAFIVCPSDCTMRIVSHSGKPFSLDAICDFIPQNFQWQFHFALFPLLLTPHFYYTKPICMLLSDALKIFHLRNFSFYFSHFLLATLPLPPQTKYLFPIMLKGP
jgi:hypothetical protein